MSKEIDSNTESYQYEPVEDDKEECEEKSLLKDIY